VPEALQALSRARSQSALEDSSREPSDAITAAVNERLTRTAREFRAMTDQGRLSGARLARPLQLPDIHKLAGALAIVTVMGIVIIVLLVLLAVHLL
jgi:hypothetical protein